MWNEDYNYHAYHERQQEPKRFNSLECQQEYHRQDYGPQNGFGPSRNGGFGPPQNGGFGPPQNGGFGPPQNGGFGPPQNGGFGPPQNGGFGPPQNGGFGPPQNGGFGPPQNRGFGPPQNGGFGPPQNGGFGPPQNGGFGQPSWCPPNQEDNWNPRQSNWRQDSNFYDQKHYGGPTTCSRGRSKGTSELRKTRWDKERKPLPIPISRPFLQSLLERHTVSKRDRQADSSTREKPESSESVVKKEEPAKEESGKEEYVKAESVKEESVQEKSVKESLKGEFTYASESDIKKGDTSKEQVTFESSSQELRTVDKKPPLEMGRGNKEKLGGKATVVSDQFPSLKYTEETKISIQPLSKSEQLPSKSEQLPSKSEQLPSKSEQPLSKSEQPPSKSEQPPSTSVQPSHSSNAVRVSKGHNKKLVEFTGERSPKSGDLKSYKIPKCNKPLEKLESKSENCQKRKCDKEKSTVESSTCKNSRRSSQDGRIHSEHRNRLSRGEPVSNSTNSPGSSRASTLSVPDRRKTLVEDSDDKRGQAKYQRNKKPEIKFRRGPREEVRKDASIARTFSKTPQVPSSNEEHPKSISAEDYLVKLNKTNSPLSGVSVSFEGTRSKNASKDSSNSSTHSSPKELFKHDQVAKTIATVPREASHIVESKEPEGTQNTPVVASNYIPKLSCTDVATTPKSLCSNSSPKSSFSVLKVSAVKLKKVSESFQDFYTVVVSDISEEENDHEVVENRTNLLSNGSTDGCTADVSVVSPGSDKAEEDVWNMTAAKISVDCIKSCDVRSGNRSVMDSPRGTMISTKDESKSSRELPSGKTSGKPLRASCADLEQKLTEFEINSRKPNVMQLKTNTEEVKKETADATNIKEPDNCRHFLKQNACFPGGPPMPPIIDSCSKPGRSESPTPTVSATSENKSQSPENAVTSPPFEIPELLQDEQFVEVLKGAVKDFLALKKGEMTSCSGRHSSKRPSKRSTHRGHSSDSTRRHTEKRERKLKRKLFVRSSGKHSSKVEKSSSSIGSRSESKRLRSSTSSDSNEEDEPPKRRRRIRAPIIESEDEETASVKAVGSQGTPKCSVEGEPPESMFQTPPRPNAIGLATPDSSACVSSCERISPVDVYDFQCCPTVVSSGSKTDTASPVGSFVVPLSNPSVVTLGNVQVDECNSTSLPSKIADLILISDSDNEDQRQFIPENEGIRRLLKEKLEAADLLESSEIVDDYPALPSPAHSTASTSSMRTVQLDPEEFRKQLEAVKMESTDTEIIYLSEDEDSDGWSAMSELDKHKIRELSELYYVCYRALKQFVLRVRDSFEYTEAVRVADEERARDELFKTFLPFCKELEDRKKSLCQNFTEDDLSKFIDEKTNGRQLPLFGSVTGFSQMVGLLKQLNKRKTKKNWKRIESLPKPSDGLSVVEEVQAMLHLPFDNDAKSTMMVVAMAARTATSRTSIESCLEVIPVISHVTSIFSMGDSSIIIKKEETSYNTERVEAPFKGYSPDTLRRVDCGAIDLMNTGISPARVSSVPAIGEPLLATLKKERRDCLACGVRAEIKCSHCGDANYCSRNCQTTHWNTVHRYNCNKTGLMQPPKN